MSFKSACRVLVSIHGVVDTLCWPGTNACMCAAAALGHLHSHNILHSDLTPNNILLSQAPADPRGFTVKVSDFGLSRMQAGDTAMSTETYGTVTHMPPELISEVSC